MDNSAIINVIQNVHKMLMNRGFDMSKINRNPPTAHMENLIKLLEIKRIR